MRLFYMLIYIVPSLVKPSLLSTPNKFIKHSYCQPQAFLTSVLNYSTMLVVMILYPRL